MAYITDSSGSEPNGIMVVDLDTGDALGGAVYNSAGASLTIENTSFVNNQNNGTNPSFGSALASASSLTINGATFTANAALGSTAPYGSSGGSQRGAIGNLDGATATISLSTFPGNQALGTAPASETEARFAMKKRPFLPPYPVSPAASPSVHSRTTRPGTVALPATFTTGVELSRRIRVST
jgi:hypothetical protein